MQKLKSVKRGRPSRKEDSQEQQSQSYSHKPSKKKLTKKNVQSKKKDALVNRKSKSKVELSSVDSFSDSEDGEKKVYKVPVQIFAAGQVFGDILCKANSEPQFLIMLKNLLSGCARLRQDKKSQYRKKWKMLRNSNCTQSQYLSRQSELKRMEAEELGQIEDDIISKLALANIRGFQTRDSIVNNYKLSLPNIDENIQYAVDQGQWNKYRDEQKKLLQILMNQNDFVSQDYKLINLNTKYVAQSSQPNTSNKQQENQMQLKFNNLQTEQNQENIQFLFCKNYTHLSYDKVFQSSNPFRVLEQEKYPIDAKAMSWLLQSKCDEIYTNQHFQKETYYQYSKLLAQMYSNPEKYSDQQLMNNILETGAYILNSVHYYQKFKLKCELLHPLDLLLVTQKINSQRIKRNNKDRERDKDRETDKQNREMLEHDGEANNKNFMVDEKDQVNQ